MRSEFESREKFECIFGDEGEIDLSKDETGEYSFQPSRFAYSFFLVAWQYRQTEVDELQKRLDAALKLIESWNKTEFDKTTHWTEGYEEGCYHCAAQLEQALKGGEACQ